MIGSLLNIFRVPDLRRKVLITLALLVVYRVGAHVPTPFINPVEMGKHFKNAFGAGGAFAVVDMFSGGAFSNMTIFALGIMPYISASIIIQLLTAVWPRLEKISKEGEAGRKKITQWTRYGTVGLSLFQGLGIGVYLNNQGLSMLPDHPLFFLIVTAITMCAGTCFVMWLGEKISQHGIGNGISLIIAVGIIARYPLDFVIGFKSVQTQAITQMEFIFVLVLMLAVSALIILNQQANRRVPVQHARRMVGRRMMQGGNTYIPLKLNTAGVIPVIFSSAILSFPTFVLPYLGQTPGTMGGFLNALLQMDSPYNIYDGLGMDMHGVFLLLKALNLYTVLYVILTAVFCFFYTAITLNPVDLADNLKKSSAFIPGIKPGKHTADFIDYILTRITTVGAIILVVIAIMPQLLFVGFDIPFAFAQVTGGTGLIIVVGVLLDTMKQIESQLMMRHYEGFKYLGGGSGRGRSTRPSVRLRRGST